MTSGDSDRPGQRGGRRRHSFARAQDRQGFLFERAVADPDLHWEATDRTDVLLEERLPHDPWGQDERLGNSASGTPTSVRSLGFDVSTPDPPPRFVRTAPQTDTTVNDVLGQMNLFTADELNDLATSASERAEPETENWRDLEEAEIDLIRAREDLISGGAQDADDYDLPAEGAVFNETAPTSDDGTPHVDDGSGEGLIADGWTGEDFNELVTEGESAFMVPAELQGPADFDFGIYDFDQDARQAPWNFESGVDETVPRRAREKAGAIASMMDVVSRREQIQAVVFLTELFEHLRHPATFQAFHQAAMEGLTPDLLYAMVALRHVWMERTDWWVGRYGRGLEFSRLSHGASALTWVQARRVCRARSDYPPEEMIDEAWFGEWLTLMPRQPGFMSFPAYVDVKVRTLEAGLLDEGLRLEERLNDYSELADGWGWYRQVPDPEDVVRLGFRILTPYDDGLGHLRMMDLVKNGGRHRE